MKALVQEDVRHGLRIAPLVDIVFLLLIFFLVATTFYDEERDLNLSLASSSEATPSASDSTTVINVRSGGEIVVRGAVVPEGTLVPTLAELARERPAAQVVIRCDRLVPHERFVDVLDACHKAGMDRLSVATRPVPVD